MGSRKSIAPEGVEKHGLVFISAQSAAPDFPGDVVAQTGIIYRKLKSLLKAAGLDFESVVKTVDYIVPEALDGYRETGAIRREYFKGSWPAATGIVVERLSHPRALIEIDAVAVRGEGKEAINPGWPRYERLTFAPAVRAGKYLWVSGFTGRRYEPEPPGFPQGVVDQAQEAYGRLGEVLRAAGATPADVVKTVDYISPGGVENYRGTRGVREEFFRGAYPASTGIVVHRLLHPEALVEVEMLALLEGERQDIVIPGWEAHYGRVTYRAGVRKGDILAVAGQGAIDPTTNKVVAEGDILAQAEYAYRLIFRVVEAAGGGPEDVVRAVEFLAPEALSRYDELASLRQELFGRNPPAVTSVAVHRLLRPGMLIEVDATAVMD